PGEHCSILTCSCWDSGRRCEPALAVTEWRKGDAWHSPWSYRGIRVWHVRGDLPDNWRELQKRAWREGAPLDALYVDYAGRWTCARDLAAEHWIHAALASDREHCRRGLWRAAAAK